MLQAYYPHICNKKTSFRLSIAGATHHPNFRHVSSIFRVVVIQPTLRELEECLLDEETNITIETLGIMTTKTHWFEKRPPRREIFSNKWCAWTLTRLKTTVRLSERTYEIIDLYHQKSGQRFPPTSRTSQLGEASSTGAGGTGLFFIQWQLKNC